MEYKEQFELLMAPLKRNERGMLESIFINGLRDEIQTELKLHNTRGLNVVMNRTLLIEERNKSLKEDNGKKNEGTKWKPIYAVSGSESGRRRIFVAKLRFEAGGSGGTAMEGKASGGEADNKPPMRRDLSNEEFRDLSKRGLYFKCGERWGRDHRCKMKHYRIVIVYEEDNGEDEEIVTEAKEVVIDSLEALKTLLLSLNSKQGLTSNKSFKVWGIINGRKVLILIDSRATSNFISKKLVEELGLLLEDTNEYTVEVGNGDKITHRGVCAGLEVTVQNITFTQDFYLMTLAGLERVLGMEWLASLGDIKANF